MEYLPKHQDKKQCAWKFEDIFLQSLQDICNYNQRLYVSRVVGRDLLMNLFSLYGVNSSYRWVSKFNHTRWKEYLTFSRLFQGIRVTGKKEGGAGAVSNDSALSLDIAMSTTRCHLLRDVRRHRAVSIVMPDRCCQLTNGNAKVQRRFQMNPVISDNNDVSHPCARLCNAWDRKAPTKLK